MLRLEIDLGEDLAELEAQLMASVPQVNRAIDRALKKTARWLETHSKRELGTALQVPQRVFKTRFFRHFSTKNGKRSVNVWFGLDSMRSIDLGNPRQTAQGVKVGKHLFSGAFIANMKSGHTGIFRRSNEFNRNFTSDERNENRQKRADGQWTELPIEEVGFPIEQIAKPILERYHVRAEARFKQILKQEINFALNVEAV
jgi:hypothetical protein